MMKKRIGSSGLSRTAQAAVAAGYGCHYGDYVAARDNPVVIEIPEYLKNAPTMFERLAGAIAPEPPRFEHIEPVELVDPVELAEPVEETEPAQAQEPLPEDGGPTPMPQRPDIARYSGVAKIKPNAEWLRSKRVAAGVTQKLLAEHCGVGKNAIGAWERDEKVPPELVDYVSRLLDWYINYGSETIRKNQHE